MNHYKILYECRSCFGVTEEKLKNCPYCAKEDTLEKKIVFENEEAETDFKPNSTSCLNNSAKKSLNNSNSFEHSNYKTFKQPELFKNIKLENTMRFSSGLSEFDRVLGGGFVEGSAVLLGGAPGIGKSTILLQILSTVIKTKKCLYISGEETSSQVKLRSNRLNINLDNLHILPSGNLKFIQKAIENEKYKFIVVDSIQTLENTDYFSNAGSISQMKGCLMSLIELAKEQNITIIFVAHINKEGIIAGPKYIEHMTDSVMYFEEADSETRIIRCIKNRFGNIDEIGIFTMTEHGLTSPNDIENFFTSSINKENKGVVFTPVIEGTRSIMTGIEVLCTPSKGNGSKIYSDKIDSLIVQKIIAVLEQYAKIRFEDMYIYINVLGGLKINDTSIELPLLLSLWSFINNISIPNNYFSFGEITLTGEIKRIMHEQKRISAAFKSGWKKYIGNSNCDILNSANQIFIEHISQINNITNNF